MVNQWTIEPQSPHAWSARNSLLSTFWYLVLTLIQPWTFWTRVFASISNYYQGTPCVFQAPKHLQSPVNFSDLCVQKCTNRQNTAPVWNSRSSIHFLRLITFGMLSRTTSPTLIQQTRCGYASQSHWQSNSVETGKRSSAGIWHDISSKWKLPKGGSDWKR